MVIPSLVRSLSIVLPRRQRRVTGVLGREPGPAAVERPADRQGRVIPSDRELRSRVVGGALFIGKDGPVLEREEAVQATGRDVELAMLAGPQILSDPAAVGRALRSHV